MGNEEAGTPAKTPKTSTMQEQLPPSSPATPYADWASYQAYYNPAGTPPIPPLGFFHSSSSPQTHPYMWGAQHMIPPYGTPPPPYVTMFPHGGLYPHPSIPPGSHPYSPYAIPTPSGTCETAVAAADATELEGKSTESKNRSPLKKSKGGLGSLTMLTGKVNEKQKASGASANGDLSQSGESGNDGSSEGSDSNSQNGSQQKTSCHQGSLSVDEGQNGATSSAMRRAPSTQTTANQTMAMIPIPPSSVTDPTTNLNIGMDFWGGTGTSSMATIRGKLPIAPTTAATVPSGLSGSRDGIPSELWLQDERELKRQRRKQSNRESARRSRLRKQAECEELAQRVESLKEENSSLRDELEHMREECQKLAAENATLTERLDEHQGQEPRSDDIRGPVDRNRERKVTYGIIEE